MTIRTSVKPKSSSCYTLLLAVSMFYFSYRYVFKWANDMSSGTYSNTPVIVQIMKYVICMVLVLISFVFALMNGKPLKTHGNISLAILFVFTSSVYAFLNVRDQNTLMIFVGISIMFGMCLTIQGDINFDFLNKLFVFFINANIIYEFIQIVLYILKGRLPAIAWVDASLMEVRFGGIFDDPFALSLFISFLIPYIFHKYHGKKRMVYFIIHTIMLVLTWTLTSIFALFGVFILDRLYVLAKGRKWNAVITMLLLGGTGIGVIFVILYGGPLLNRILGVKVGSIATHLETWSLDGLSILTFLGLAPKAHYAETSISKLLFTNGIFFTIIFYSLGLCSVRRFRRIIDNLSLEMMNYKPIFLGMMYYQLTFLIGSINLPFPYMYFNMVVFSIFAGISFVIRIEIHKSKYGGIVS